MAINNLKRLDKILVEKKIVSSRQKATELIKQGKILVNNQIITKPAAKIRSKAKIESKATALKWVSRAGLKLVKALNYWDINVKNLICLDIGSSTGGFVDVLLHYGAKKIYAVDVGHDQLAPQLGRNPKVINLEKTNIRSLEKNKIKNKIDLITIDVSFISLKIVLKTILKFLEKDTQIIALIKPQFEVGKEKINKGIVKNPDLHQKIIKELSTFANNLNLQVIDVIESPITGVKGNKEFLIYLKK